MNLFVKMIYGIREVLFSLSAGHLQWEPYVWGINLNADCMLSLIFKKVKIKINIAKTYMTTQQTFFNYRRKQCYFPGSVSSYMNAELFANCHLTLTLVNMPNMYFLNVFCSSHFCHHVGWKLRNKQRQLWKHLKKQNEIFRCNYCCLTAVGIEPATYGLPILDTLSVTPVKIKHLISIPPLAPQA